MYNNLTISLRICLIIGLLVIITVLTFSFLAAPIPTYFLVLGSTIGFHIYAKLRNSNWFGREESLNNNYIKNIPFY